MKKLLVLVVGIVIGLTAVTCLDVPSLVQQDTQRSVRQEKGATHSFSWKRGYNDGWSGMWLSPVHWLVSSEYKAGWTQGMSDHKNGKPYNPSL